MSGRQPVLVMIQGTEPGVVYRLPDNRVTTIGRSTRNSVRVVNPSVSRFHCELSYVNGRWELHDLNSKKGTIVNGEPIAEGRALNPGDIIRLATAVFRFDMIDESLDQDEALLAIKEAELDVRLTRQPTSAQWLDEVMARNRMESKDLRDADAPGYSLKANALFLAVVAGLVVVGVLLSLRLAPGNAPDARPAQAAAQAAYAAALKALDSGNPQDALKELRQVEQDYPQTAEARQAALKRQETEEAVLDQGLRRLATLEGEGDYAQAFRVRAEVQDLGLGPEADKMLADREQFLRRLANAAYKAMEKSARQRLSEGDRQAALEVYRRMRDSVGIPELSAAAAQKVQELEGAG